MNHLVETILDPREGETVTTKCGLRVPFRPVPAGRVINGVDGSCQACAIADQMTVAPLRKGSFYVHGTAATFVEDGVLVLPKVRAPWPALPDLTGVESRDLAAGLASAAGTGPTLGEPERSAVG